MQAIDVTPQVWARVQKIRDANACVCCGSWSDGERQALDLYGLFAAPRLDRFVVGQIGQSLDGRIATLSGDAQDVSGRDGLAHLHRLRALVDAVVVGVKTALHDNPRLTVRLAQGRNPARVVIDPSGRLPNSTALLHDTSARRVVIQSVPKARPQGVEVIMLPRDRWMSPATILDALEDLGFGRILIEGGATTIAQFLEADLLDHLHVAVAPLLIGAGPHGLTTSPVATLAQARRPKTDIFSLGSDVLFDCKLTPAACRPAIPNHHQQPTLSVLQ